MHSRNIKVLTTASKTSLIKLILSFQSIFRHNAFFLATDLKDVELFGLANCQCAEICNLSKSRLNSSCKSLTFENILAETLGSYTQTVSSIKNLNILSVFLANFKLKFSKCWIETSKHRSSQTRRKVRKA